MLEAIEATIDPFGNVRLNKKVRLNRFHRAVVTILDEEPIRTEESEWLLAGSMTLVDEDLESASREISEEMNRAIDRSAEELRRSFEK